MLLEFLGAYESTTGVLNGRGLNFLVDRHTCVSHQADCRSFSTLGVKTRRFLTDCQISPRIADQPQDPSSFQLCGTPSNLISVRMKKSNFLVAKYKYGEKREFFAGFIH